MHRGGAALFAAALAAAPAGAATVNDYTSFHVLGDSLSDAGNVYRATFRMFPESPPYYRGRFSNGPVWADRVVAAFRAEGLPTGNHAWGGANVVGGGIDVPDLSMQAARYRSIDEDRRGDRPLVAIWSGGNDVLDAAGDRGARRLGRRVARRVGDVATGLLAAGTRDFLILNLPDIGRVPKFGDDPGDGRSATRASRAFNRTLADEIADLRAAGARVRGVDVYRLFQDLLAHPRRYGVRNTETPCLDEDDNPCSRRQGRRRAFFDEIHPNLVVHRRIAEAAMARIERSGGVTAVASTAAPAAPAPVPLPPAAALLVAALAGLAGLARATSAAGAGRGRRRGR
jgi:outer membrane lipase/esterase